MTLANTQERLCVVAVLAAMALVVLDAGIVNVALPVIAIRCRRRPRARSWW